MQQTDFTTALEHELQTRCVPFDLADVLEFAGSVGPMARDNPEPVRWADEFLQSVAGACEITTPPHCVRHSARAAE